MLAEVWIGKLDQIVTVYCKSSPFFLFRSYLGHLLQAPIYPFWPFHQRLFHRTIGSHLREGHNLAVEGTIQMPKVSGSDSGISGSRILIARLERFLPEALKSCCQAEQAIEMGTDCVVSQNSCWESWRWVTITSGDPGWSVMLNF